MTHNLKGNGIGLFDGSDVCVARLSRTAKAAWAVHDIRVLAMVCRTAEQDVEQTRRERSRCRSGKSRGGGNVQREFARLAARMWLVMASDRFAIQKECVIVFSMLALCDIS